MRKTSLLLPLVLLSLLLCFSNYENASATDIQQREQQTELQHEAIAVNIEVPVRFC